MTVGPYTGSYKTIDGGLTWQTLPLSSNLCFNQGMYFTDENNGFIGGSGCFQSELIDRLSDGVWSPASVPITFISGFPVVDIDFYDQSFGLAAGSSGYILRTIDGGLNWDTIPIIPTEEFNYIPLTSVLIVNDTLCLAGYNNEGSGFGILISTDAGLTWTQDINSATFYYPAFLGIHQSTIGNIYVGAKPSNIDGGLIFRNNNDFENWEIDLVNQGINDLYSYNQDVVFGVGDSGYVVVNSELPFSQGLDDLINDNDIQIFPNPSADFITIESLTNKKIETIKIYSSSGKLITYKDNYERIINIKKLPLGIYFIKIQLNGKIVVKKFLKE
jgi:hypothetical protein